MRITDADRRWAREIKHYVKNEDEKMPPVDRFNAGQKQFYWVMFAGTILLVLSGLVMWAAGVCAAGSELGSPDSHSGPCDRGAGHDRRVHHPCLYGRFRRSRRHERNGARRCFSQSGRERTTGFGLTVLGKDDRRIDRAAELARIYPFASDILTFYREIASFQRDVYEQLRERRNRGTAAALPCSAPLD